ncbi:ArnT family glycosyltransferase [Sphingomonas sp.]|uniref:ArnT family glycosyltransferase n=1 Tax=Sphingomonas sp. TaxID=28214 RepID=UPI003D6C9500
MARLSQDDARPVMRFSAARRSDMLVMAGGLLIAALFLFLDVRPLPILLWDESRNIVNALEMDRSGFGLVTTYRGAPDLWNTKPPLLIWLMVASVRLFGESEWALRLPGMIATLGTLTIVMLFVRRITGSAWTAVLAALLLAASPGLFGEHGARTADYDSLLIFFSTAYLLLLFGAVHRRRPAGKTLALIGLCVVGAILTKSVAGVIPCLGVGLYLLLIRRVPRLWQSRGYAATGVAVAGAVALFLLVREIGNPGYLLASWHNDVGGRFTESLIGDRKPAAFYLSILWAGYVAAPLLLVLAPVALTQTSGRARAALLYSLSVCVTLLLVISLAASKLHHYVLPALPFMAIAAAITLRAIILRLIAAHAAGDPRHRIRAIAVLLVGLFSLFSAAQSAVARRYLIDPPYEGANAARYGALFDRLAAQPRPIMVVDPGFVRDEDRHYTPVLLAYRLLWQGRGVPIGWATALDSGAPAGIGVIASCDPDIVALLQKRGRDIGGVAGCAAIVRR